MLRVLAGGDGPSTVSGGEVCCVFETFLPMDLRSPNRKEHWATRMRRIKVERERTGWWLLGHGFAAWAKEVRGKGKLVVTMIRFAKKRMDDDNLVAALKGVRDEVARMLCVDDGDEESVVFCYGQKIVGPSHAPGVMIRVVVEGSHGHNEVKQSCR